MKPDKHKQKKNRVYKKKHGITNESENSKETPGTATGTQGPRPGSAATKTQGKGGVTGGKSNSGHKVRGKPSGTTTSVKSAPGPQASGTTIPTINSQGTENELHSDENSQTDEATSTFSRRKITSNWDRYKELTKEELLTLKFEKEKRKEERQAARAAAAAASDSDGGSGEEYEYEDSEEESSEENSEEEREFLAAAVSTQKSLALKQFEDDAIFMPADRRVYVDEESLKEHESKQRKADQQETLGLELSEGDSASKKITILHQQDMQNDEDVMMGNSSDGIESATDQNLEPKEDELDAILGSSENEQTLPSLQTNEKLYLKDTVACGVIELNIDDILEFDSIDKSATENQGSEAIEIFSNDSNVHKDNDIHIQSTAPCDQDMKYTNCPDRSTELPDSKPSVINLEDELDILLSLDDKTISDKTKHAVVETNDVDDWLDALVES